MLKSFFFVLKQSSINIFLDRDKFKDQYSSLFKQLQQSVDTVQLLQVSVHKIELQLLQVSVHKTE